MKKFLVIGIAALTLVGCGKDKKNVEVKYIDGTYHGESKTDEWGGKVTTDITIENGKITSATLNNLLKDGSQKGEDYGKENGKITNEGLYKIAQNAVKNAKEYPKQLVEKGNIDQVDVISGATVSHASFKEAVENALKDATLKGSK